MSVVATVVKGFGHALAAVAGPRLSILIFHRVLPTPDPLLPDEPDAAAFEARMRWLGSAFRVMPLVEASRRLGDGTLPANAACITFDDGYADNLTVAAPILARLQMTATFFITTGFLDGGRMFNDTVIEAVRLHRGDALDLTSLGLGLHDTHDDAARRACIGALLLALKYLPQATRDAQVEALATHVGLPPQSDLMMTRDQIRALRNHGMSVGAHTATHPILKNLALADARAEIDDGRRALEDIVRDRVKVFAYPNGKPGHDYDASHVSLVRELGFDTAVSTAWGVSDRRTDRFQLRRFTPWDRGVDRFGLRLAQNLVLRSAVISEPTR